MAKRLKRTHYVRVAIAFDKPCSRRLAVREFKDAVWGEFPTPQYKDTDPTTFTIRSVSSAKERA